MPTAGGNEVDKRSLYEELRSSLTAAGRAAHSLATVLAVYLPSNSRAPAAEYAQAY